MLRETGVAPREAEGLVVRVVQRHSAALLRLARRHSLCQDDAQDAYQRALEVFMRRADTLDPDTAHSWLFTVVRHEAIAVREQRQQTVDYQEVDFERLDERNEGSPEERAIDFDHVTRSAEALGMLKPQEVRALWLKACGHSYKEIAAELDWTYTKVNRCISEGRRAFLRHYAAIDSGEACAQWAPSLDAVLDGEATSRQALQVRRHLRNCPGCRATAGELHRVSAPLAVVLPGLLALEPVASSGDHAGLLVRTYEAVAQLMTERAAASTMKLQAIVDAASAGKVAAVAASAAALAGSGAVTVREVVAEPREPSSHAARKVQRAGAHVPAGHASAAVALVPASSTRAVQPRPVPAVASPRRSSASGAALRLRRQRGSATRRRPRTRTARATTEFTGLPAGGSSANAAPRAGSAARPPAPAPTVAPAPAAAFERAAAPAPTSSSATSGSAAAAREFAP